MTDDGTSDGRTPDGAASVDPVEVAEEWDEGLAPQRTQLAWGRTGLAVAVAVAVLARRAWTVGGPFELAALAAVGLGALVWLIGMRQSRDLHLHMEPHGLVGTRAFALVASGTLLLAVGSAVFGILLPH